MKARTIKIEGFGDFAKGQVMPRIRLGGKWLAEAGFKPGEHLTAELGETPGVLTLRATVATVAEAVMAAVAAATPPAARNEVFAIQVGGQEVWRASCGGKIIQADFNSKGAAEAAIAVEIRRASQQAALVVEATPQAAPVVAPPQVATPETAATPQEATAPAPQVTTPAGEAKSAKAAKKQRAKQPQAPALAPA